MRICVIRKLGSRCDLVDDVVSIGLISCAAVVPLESVPDPNKDWHPGSDGLVLDPVNPFLYPVVLEHTMDSCSESRWIPRCTSHRFQWLPSDFFVDPNGNVTLTSPYINNINPTLHKDLYPVIPEILQRAVPMFERVLSDAIRPLLRMRIATSVEQGQWFEETADCIWDSVDSRPSARPKKGGRKSLETGFGDNPFKTPDARTHYDGDLEVMKDRISLRGRTIQIIVKLSNIVLTPEKPCYPGGRWHVEGLCQLFHSFGYRQLKCCFKEYETSQLFLVSYT